MKGEDVGSLDDRRGATANVGPGDDPDADPGEELEAAIEHADHAFGMDAFGTTAAEQEEGESLDRRLAAERWVDRPVVDDELALEDEDGPDDEPALVGHGSIAHDPFVSPEEAALTVRDDAPGAVDRPDDGYVESYERSLGEDGT